MEIIKLHPPFTHFAIAMPVALFVLHMYYRLTKREADKLHLLFTLLAALSVLSASISGAVAYEPIEDMFYQIPGFSVHKYLGLFLSIYFVILLLIRLTVGAKGIFTLMLILGLFLMFLQGYLGGSIVYDHMVKPWLGK